jgi:MFS family permease
MKNDDQSCKGGTAFSQAGSTSSSTADLQQHQQQQQLLQQHQAASQELAAASPWPLLLNKHILLECGLVFACQTARTSLDMLIPMSLPDVPSWVLGLVNLGEALGSVLAPFALDWVLARRALDTYKVLVWLFLGMSVTSATALYAAHAGPGPQGAAAPMIGVALIMFGLGANQASAEALIYAHLTDDLVALRGPAAHQAVDFTMNLFSLFWVLGFTVGSYVPSMVPDPSAVWQLQLLGVGLGVVLAFCPLAMILSKKPKPQNT